MKTKRKILAFGIILCMLFALATMPASAETEGYYTYTVSNGEATITGADSSISSDITIPDTLGGYPVTSIGDSAFFDCENITSITIPNSVTSIGSGAFSYCLNLESVTIPDSVTSIGYSAFSFCENLTSISIGNGVTSIEFSMFEGCPFTNISIGNSVTNIDNQLLMCLPNLTGIEVSQNNQTYSSKDGVLFNKDKTTLVFCSKGKTGSYSIPNSVTSIGDWAFESCHLTSIGIPNSLMSIGDYAFGRCYGLKDIYYSGTAWQWNSIRIKSNNDALESATIHYGCGPTAVTISETDCTEDSIKLISHMVISLGDTPTAFGTTFIPLWLFSDPSATPATVEYSVSELSYRVTHSVQRFRVYPTDIKMYILSASHI